MTAYVVAVRDEVTDQASMDIYRAKAGGALAGHDLTPLAAYGEVRTLEGPPVDGAVILAFPTIEEAEAWYNSPAYQEVLPHRLKGGKYRMFIIQGLG